MMRTTAATPVATPAVATTTATTATTATANRGDGQPAMALAKAWAPLAQQPACCPV